MQIMKNSQEIIDYCISKIRDNKAIIIKTNAGSPAFMDDTFYSGTASSRLQSLASSSAKQNHKTAQEQILDLQFQLQEKDEIINAIQQEFEQMQREASKMIKQKEEDLRDMECQLKQKSVPC